jgi:hypothetical protein
VVVAVIGPVIVAVHVNGNDPVIVFGPVIAIVDVVVTVIDHVTR